MATSKEAEQVGRRVAGARGQRSGRTSESKASGARGRRGTAMWLWLTAALGLAVLAFGLALPPTPAAADSWDPTAATCTTNPAASYTVPAGTRYLLVDAIGGTGLYGTTDTPGNNGGKGGTGAEVKAIIPASPGQQLKVGVGRNGGVNDGYSGRPNGAFSFPSNGGGGGSSVVTTSSGDPCLGCNEPLTQPDQNICQSSSYQAPAVDRTQILVLAGGGGGGGGASAIGSGGDGGSAGANADLSGQAGSDAWHTTCGYGSGGGGGSTAVGNGGSGGCFGYDGGAGGTPNGFFGGMSVNSGTNPTIGGGGSGGGGWYGGGAGGSGFALGGGGGGAGSSHVDSSAVFKSISQDTKGSPSVTITPYQAPTTTAALSGTTSGNAWYTSAPTVTLTATAGQPGVSVGHTYYALDNAACNASTVATQCQAYSAPFSVNSQGLHTLTFFSVDANNVDEAVETQSFVVTLNGAAVSNASLSTSTTNPTASTGGAAGTPNSVSVRGSGTGLVGAALYTSNPGGAPVFNSSGAYVDVIAAGSGLTSLTFEDCDLNGGSQVTWWNSASSSWVPVSNQTYNSATGCVTVTVNGTTTPSLSQLTGTPFVPVAPTACNTAIGANFNGTAISAGSTIWLSAVLKAHGLGSTPVTVYLENATVTLAGNPTPYPVPDGKVTFSPSATTATTVFDSAHNRWETTVPTSLGGHIFLDGLALPVTAGLPGNIHPVTWSGKLLIDTAGVSVNWQWGAAVYNTFSRDHTKLGTKPVDVGQASAYQNDDPAGTPEHFKAGLIAGATGGGGSNYTGDLSATKSCP